MELYPSSYFKPALAPKIGQLVSSQWKGFADPVQLAVDLILQPDPCFAYQYTESSPLQPFGCQKGSSHVNHVASQATARLLFFVQPNGRPALNDQTLVKIRLRVIHDSLACLIMADLFPMKPPQNPTLPNSSSASSSWSAACLKLDTTVSPYTQIYYYITTLHTLFTSHMLTKAKQVD